MTTVIPVANEVTAERETQYNRIIMSRMPWDIGAINISEKYVTDACRIKRWHMPDGIHANDEGMESVFQALMPLMVFFSVN